jgi:flagellar protein FliS
MANYLFGLQTYKQNRIVTADPGTILLALYQGAIDFLRRAKVGMETGDVVEKGLCIQKTLAILSEFQTSLDFEAGGEVAKNLDDPYVYMIDQIKTANMSNDPKPIDNVMSLLKTLQ